MNDTKEQILKTSLSLFAKDGFEAVSVNDIAAKLSLTKGALYRHYKSKQDIFESILTRMASQDSKNASTSAVPDEEFSKKANAYKETSLENILQFSEAQFRYWTENAFASDFRKMLTVEQFRSRKMKHLYQQYLANGPLNYVADLFYAQLGNRNEAKRLALDFYGPMFLLYSVYDAAADKKAVLKSLQNHFSAFAIRQKEILK